MFILCQWLEMTPKMFLESALGFGNSKVLEFITSMYLVCIEGGITGTMGSIGECLFLSYTFSFTPT